MRTRTIMTVALLTAAGCGTSGAPRRQQADKPVASEAVAAAEPAPTVMALPAPVTAASAPTPPAAPLTEAQLELLADELRRTDAKVVAARADHFRPLCDAQGYPLVGNLAMKSASPGPIATYCAGFRKTP